MSTIATLEETLGKAVATGGTVKGYDPFDKPAVDPNDPFGDSPTSTSDSPTSTSSGSAEPSDWDDQVRDPDDPFA